MSSKHYLNMELPRIINEQLKQSILKGRMQSRIKFVNKQ